MQASPSTILKTVVKSQVRNSNLFISYLFKPSLNAGFCYFFVSFFIISCSTFKLPGTKRIKNLYPSGFISMSPTDYADHLASLKDALLSTTGIKIVKNRFAKKYVQSLAGEIISKNEIFFKNLREVDPTILEMDAPVHFSLPKGEIFLSSGLISKYIKNESMLISILSYELVRSENLLYPKQTIVPTGYIPIERLLSHQRLNLEEKMEIHKWAHYLTVRSGYDGEYYLSWLQTQNRNTADFILQVGDINLINREEAAFKAHLIKISKKEEVPGKKNSSRSFYTFINSIRDQSI
jgi:hypothetical protein